MDEGQRSIFHGETRVGKAQRGVGEVRKRGSTPLREEDHIIPVSLSTSIRVPARNPAGHSPLASNHKYYPAVYHYVEPHRSGSLLSTLLKWLSHRCRTSWNSSGDGTLRTINSYHARVKHGYTVRALSPPSVRHFNLPSRTACRGDSTNTEHIEVD